MFSADAYDETSFLDFINYRDKDLIFLDESMHLEGDNILSCELYFFVNKESIILSNSLKKIITAYRSSGAEVLLSDVLSSCYLASGLVVPPFTIYEGIYRMPVFSCFTKSNGVVEQGFDRSILDVTSFESEQEVFECLGGVIRAALHREAPVKTLCTLSGGADSAVLLSLLKSEARPEEIDTLCCEMPGLLGEVRKAEDIARICGVNFLRFRPTSVDPALSIENYTRTYRNLVFDPVVPVITEMLQDYRQNNTSHINDKICLIEGQGADTVMFGLPHALTLALYREELSPIFRGLSTLIPEANDQVRMRSRTLYRALKTIHLLSAESWQESILYSLDLHILKGTNFYKIYLKMINQYFIITQDRQKALILFFLQVVAVREMQKYQMLEEEITPILPFLDKEFVAKCLSSKTTMFFRFPSRKIPIFRRAKKYFGSIFKSKKTVPFIVEYKEEEILSGPVVSEINDDVSFRKYCLEALKKN